MFKFRRGVSHAN